jgi:eukaryotic-like serine/threonine-protein kinase
MRPPESGPYAPSPTPLDATAPVTEESRAFFQERLALFTGVMALLGFAFWAVLSTAAVFARGLPWHAALTRPSLLFTLVGGGMAGVTWALCRSRRRLPIWLLHCMDAGVLLAMLVFKVKAYQDGHTQTLLLTSQSTLVFRAIVVPSTGRRTFWISLIGELPNAVVVALLALRAPQVMVASVLLPTLDAALWGAGTVGIATLASRVIYGLRERVREARELGQYRLGEKLGEGGMGAVYLASHKLLRRPTAIKLLHPDKAGAHNLERFEREVQLTSRLSHPNIVSVYDYGCTPDGIFYYAMEHLDGVDLELLLRAEGPLPPARVLHVLEQVAAALGEAHAVGLIHRDVKPANVLLCQVGQAADVAKVVDFGLVKDLAPGGEEDLTQAQALTGTPLYMSPEAITTPAAVDARSDLYALGALGYALLTGRPVFDGRNAVEVCAHHLHSAPVPPRERLGRAVPEDLEALLLACLEKAPARRPQSAEALRDLLSACRDAGRWTQADARAWWETRGEAVRRRPAGDAREALSVVQVVRPAA